MFQEQNIQASSGRSPTSFYDAVSRYAQKASGRKYKKGTRYEAVDSTAITYISSKTDSEIHILPGTQQGTVKADIRSKYVDTEDVEQFIQKKTDGDFSMETVSMPKIGSVLNTLWLMEEKEIRFSRIMQLAEALMVFIFILYMIFSQVAIRTMDSGMSLAEDGTLQYSLNLTNIRGKSWVRVKLDLSASNNIDSQVLEEGLIFTDGWEKHGDWYYYTKPAERGETYQVITGTTLNVSDIGSLSIGVTGQAGQYLFTFPDFDNDDPWYHLTKKLNIGVRGIIDVISP